MGFTLFIDGFTLIAYYQSDKIMQVSLKTINLFPKKNLY